MARLNRLCPVGIPQHIIQRGNNRQVCFNGDENMAAYAQFPSRSDPVILTRQSHWILR